MLVKLEDGNLKDVKLTDVTPANYIVPEGEEDNYHVIIEQKAFNPSTGERLSRPRLQKFNAKMWQGLMMEQLRMQGFTTTILHDPTDYLKEQEAEKAKMKELQRQAKINAKAKADEARQKEIDKAVQKAVAEALAKVKQSKGKIDADKRNSKG